MSDQYAAARAYEDKREQKERLIREVVDDIIDVAESAASERGHMDRARATLEGSLTRLLDAL